MNANEINNTKRVKINNNLRFKEKLDDIYYNLFEISSSLR